MKSIVLKISAIVLCLIFAFTIVLPQADAQVSQQDCNFWETACLIATIVTQLICADNPNSNLCELATIVTEAICQEAANRCN